MALNDKDGEFDGPLTEHYSRPMFMARHGALSRMTCILPTYYVVDLSPSLRSISRLYLFFLFYFYIFPFLFIILSSGSPSLSPSEGASFTRKNQEIK